MKNQIIWKGGAILAVFLIAALILPMMAATRNKYEDAASAIKQELSDFQVKESTSLFEDSFYSGHAQLRGELVSRLNEIISDAEVAIDRETASYEYNGKGSSAELVNNLRGIKEKAIADYKKEKERFEVANGIKELKKAGVGGPRGNPEIGMTPEVNTPNENPDEIMKNELKRENPCYQAQMSGSAESICRCIAYTQSAGRIDFKARNIANEFASNIKGQKMILEVPKSLRWSDPYLCSDARVSPVDFYESGRIFHTSYYLDPATASCKKLKRKRTNLRNQIVYYVDQDNLDCSKCVKWYKNRDSSSLISLAQKSQRLNRQVTDVNVNRIKIFVNGEDRSSSGVAPGESGTAEVKLRATIKEGYSNRLAGCGVKSSEKGEREEEKDITIKKEFTIPPNYGESTYPLKVNVADELSYTLLEGVFSTFAQRNRELSINKRVIEVPIKVNQGQAPSPIVKSGKKSTGEGLLFFKIDGKDVFVSSYTSPSMSLSGGEHTFYLNGRMKNKEKLDRCTLYLFLTQDARGRLYADDGSVKGNVIDENQGACPLTLTSMLKPGQVYWVDAIGYKNNVKVASFKAGIRVRENEKKPVNKKETAKKKEEARKKGTTEKPAEETGTAKQASTTPQEKAIPPDTTPKGTSTETDTAKQASTTLKENIILPKGKTISPDGTLTTRNRRAMTKEQEKTIPLPKVTSTPENTNEARIKELLVQIMQDNYEISEARKALSNTKDKEKRKELLNKIIELNTDKRDAVQEIRRLMNNENESK